MTSQARLPRGLMDPADRERAQARERYTAYRRATGRPVRTSPDRAIRHARRMQARGMTVQEMADQVGVAKSTVSDLIRGRRTSDKGGTPIRDIPCEISNAVLSIRFEEPSRLGADVDSLGTRRRLQALAAHGFSGPFLARALDVSTDRVHVLTHRSNPVKAVVAARVSALYDKLHLTDPLDHGITPYSVSRAKGTAKRNGYAPPSCWDIDTVDDPKAFPEWTGACGTQAGARLHTKYAIPRCPACQGAIRVRREEIKKEKAE